MNRGLSVLKTFEHLSKDGAVTEQVCCADIAMAFPPYSGRVVLGGRKHGHCQEELKQATILHTLMSLSIVRGCATCCTASKGGADARLDNRMAAGLLLGLRRHHGWCVSSLSPHSASMSSCINPVAVRHAGTRGLTKLFLPSFALRLYLLQRPSLAEATRAGTKRSGLNAKAGRRYAFKSVIALCGGELWHALARACPMLACTCACGSGATARWLQSLRTANQSLPAPVL